MLRVRLVTGLAVKSRVHAGRAPRGAADYYHAHRDSPIALACGQVGAVTVSEAIKPEIEHAVGPRDLRCAYGLGIISRLGTCPADVHQHESGLWPDVTPDEYLVRWISTGVKWHRQGPLALDPPRESWDDLEAAYNAPAVVVGQVDSVSIRPVRPRLDAYLQRLVHPPKVDYAYEVLAAFESGRPVPELDERWADDVVRKVRRFMSL